MGNANPTITSSNPFKTRWKGDLAKLAAQFPSHLPLNLMLACLVPLKKISSNPDWTTAWKEPHALSWTQQWLTTWVFDLRTAAYINSVSKIFKTYRDAGL